MYASRLREYRQLGPSKETITTKINSIRAATGMSHVIRDVRVNTTKEKSRRMPIVSQ